LEFRILGPLEVVDEGRVLSLGSGRQLALVGLLLLHANEPVSVDRLVDELWGESPPPTAAKIVRNSVSLLRRELGDRLVTHPPGYLLRVDPGELDSERLELAVESGDLDSLNEALALWRGPPLAQLGYDGFAQNEIARLEELRLVALEARIDAQLGAGRHATAVPELEGLVQRHPLRERLCGQLMLALYRSGRQAEALEAYRRARRSLDEELGIEPGPALKELERKILNQDESLSAPPAAAPEAPSGRRRSVVLGAAGVLVAAAAVAVFLVTGDSASGLPEVPPNYVGLIDPGTNTVVAAIPVGIGPGPVAGGAGSVWVANVRDRSLTRIDAAQRAPVATVSLAGRTPTGLAVGAGAVWVAHGLRGELSRVEIQFGQITDTVVVAGRAHGAPNGSVAVGAGHVWTAFGDSTLARVERSPARPAGSVLVGPSPSAVAVGGGAVWVANSADATVQRFNPVTFEEGPIRTISVGRRPTALAFGEGALWVANQGDDSVTRVDPGTGATDVIRVGDAPVGVAVGSGAVWVASEGDRTVSRIDPGMREVEQTIDTGNPPAGIAVVDGSVWVTVRAPD
jgi:YVTN family beta-propeller protein